MNAAQNMQNVEPSPDALWRVLVDGMPQLAVGPVAAGPVRLLPDTLTIGALLSGDEVPSIAALADFPTCGAVPADATVLAPVDVQPVWAAGVTFERSRSARAEESESAADVYDRVFIAERPELFFKSAPEAVRGPGQPICIRSDSTWDVPEPELGLLVDATGRICGYLLGNDMSSRSIEGENPLYLPQAKVYDGSCALGPCIVPVGDAPPLSDMTIHLEISRENTAVYADQVSLAGMYRKPGDLVDWVMRAHSFPAGLVLLTGTSIVPSPDFSLQPGDMVTIAAAGLGILANPVFRTAVHGKKES